MQIDNSQLQCYIDCPRKYFYKYVECLEKIKLDESDVDREFGKCFHKAIELLYKGKGLSEAQEVFRKEFNLIETEKAKTPANGELLVEAYRNYWSNPVNEMSDTNLETVNVEKVQTFRLSDDIEWLVKHDRIAKNKAGYWAVETKTTSKMAWNYFRKFDLNMQISGQCEGIKREYGQCSGAIINVACIGYRERAYRGEPAGFHCEFAREIINRNEAQLLDWRAQVFGWARRLDKSLKTYGVGDVSFAFPQNTQACWNFKGCSFIELCKSCGDENVKEVMYRKCDPLEYLKGEEGESNDKS